MSAASQLTSRLSFHLFTEWEISLSRRSLSVVPTYAAVWQSSAGLMANGTHARMRSRC